MALGQLGAMMGDVLLTVMISYDDWQQASIHAAMFGLLLTFALAVTFRFSNKFVSEEHGIAADAPSTSEVIKSFCELTRNRELWKTSLMGCLPGFPSSCLPNIWVLITSSLPTASSSEQAAMANAMIFIGMASGGPLSDLFVQYATIATASNQGWQCDFNVIHVIGSLLHQYARRAVIFMPILDWPVHKHTSHRVSCSEEIATKNHPAQRWRDQHDGDDLWDHLPASDWLLAQHHRLKRIVTQRK